MGLCSVAEATEPPLYWQADVVLAESGTVPENARGLIVQVNASSMGPAVPAELELLSSPERQALAAEITAYGQLAVLDDLEQPRSIALQIHDQALWLAFSLEPGSYRFVAELHQPDSAELRETPFMVVPAVALPTSAGEIETFVECDQGSYCDTTRDLYNGARLVYSPAASPFASVLLHRWWPSLPPYSWDHGPPGLAVWSRWQPGDAENLWARSCATGVSYWGQLEEATHEVRVDTLLGGAWQELSVVETTMTVSCEDCDWQPLPPDCPEPGAGAGSSAGGSGGSIDGAAAVAPTAGCTCSAPRSGLEGPGWILAALIAAAAACRRRPRP